MGYSEGYYGVVKIKLKTKTPKATKIFLFRV